MTGPKVKGKEERKGKEKKKRTRKKGRARVTLVPSGGRNAAYGKCQGEMP